jgi:hypothetical protein
MSVEFKAPVDCIYDGECDPGNNDECDIIYPGEATSVRTLHNSDTSDNIYVPDSESDDLPPLKYDAERLEYYDSADENEEENYSDCGTCLWYCIKCKRCSCHPGDTCVPVFRDPNYVSDY